MRAFLCGILVGTPLLVPSSAQAQLGVDPSFSVEIASDQRRRGLSWSDGDVAAHAQANARIADSLEVGAGITTARGSRRHGGADAAVDLSARYLQEAGGWRLSAGVTGHLFPGASGQGYVELDGRAGYAIGPVQLSAGASYAPAQGAIGGDNLYLMAGADVGLPGTPITLYGHVGRSSGSVDDPRRVLRLRPAGRYWDYSVGAEYFMGPFGAGLRYTDTSIDAVNLAAPFVDPHVGGRLIGSLSVRF